MNGNILTESWSRVTKWEVLGWFFFTGVFSFFMAHYTSLWKIDSYKEEGSYLIYKAIMLVLFLVIGFVLLKYGEKAASKGKNQVEIEDMIRTFSGQVLFTVILSVTLLLESVMPSFRSIQWLEYLQGMCYFGLLTGVGMTWYHIGINYIPKSEREIESNQEGV